MKHTVRAFSVGLIAAGLILLAVFYLFGHGNEGAAEYSTEELIEKIEEEGLRVVSEEEYISITLGNNESNENEDEAEETETEETEDSAEIETANQDSEENDEEETESEEEKEDEAEEEEETPSPVVITVEPGMATSYISDLLEEEGLIDDAAAFNEYLIDNDYSLRVQMGDHELEHGLSEYEIAEQLTSN
ncbi:endolytic transglycosylase MltG [Oceanobacillus alkalisoli]|uniref:endolytic transglycosylase MltG n=1 Tax=Oceanobacillus alkalisoli TaxID=2925113 RepID=UPI001EEF8EC5|nr:endolytic transglycosylase MltG [Oceanobacillus alkalisoli]MCF3941776.1 endolytic transglycosylase MltG [Oceanobacillus alkalisoli]MCG5103056.1 endolytic transglycosylase MltG [Oceanobacillus alkalisoli]